VGLCGHNVLGVVNAAVNIVIRSSLLSSFYADLRTELHRSRIEVHGTTAVRRANSDFHRQNVTFDRQICANDAIAAVLLVRSPFMGKQVRCGKTA